MRLHSPRGWDSNHVLRTSSHQEKSKLPHPAEAMRANSRVFVRFMRSLHFTVAKAAVANVVRGGASEVVAIVLPHFLTRAISIRPLCRLGTDATGGCARQLFRLGFADDCRALSCCLSGEERYRALLTNAIASLSGAGSIAICSLRNKRIAMSTVLRQARIPCMSGRASSRCAYYAARTTSATISARR